MGCSLLPGLVGVPPQALLGGRAVTQPGREGPSCPLKGSSTAAGRPELGHPPGIWGGLCGRCLSGLLGHSENGHFLGSCCWGSSPTRHLLLSSQMASLRVRTGLFCAAKGSRHHFQREIRMHIPASVQVRSRGLIVEKSPEEDNGDFHGWCLGKDHGLQAERESIQLWFLERVCTPRGASAWLPLGCTCWPRSGAPPPISHKRLFSHFGGARLSEPGLHMNFGMPGQEGLLYGVRVDRGRVRGGNMDICVSSKG